MPELLRYALLSLIVLLTHFQEAVTGFGCTVLALPFVIFLLGVDTAVKVLVIQAWMLAIFIVISSRKNIVWRQYLRIVFFAGVGLPLGMLMINRLPESQLKLILGVFMVGVAVRGLMIQLRKKQVAKWSPSAAVNWLMNGVLFLGGVIHGAFGSGGPFVVIYATRALPEKSLFRVTLCMLWLSLNSIMIAKWGISHALTRDIWSYTLICTPFTVIGMIIGDRCHHRINEHVFRLLVFGVLFLSGIAVLYSVIHAFGA